MYGFITNASIEKMRNSARLVVGQVRNEKINLYMIKTTDKHYCLISVLFQLCLVCYVLCDMQTLMDTSKKSILRAMMEESKFSRSELDQLYSWFHEGHRQVRCNNNSCFNLNVVLLIHVHLL